MRQKDKLLHEYVLKQNKPLREALEWFLDNSPYMNNMGSYSRLSPIHKKDNYLEALAEFNDQDFIATIDGTPETKYWIEIWTVKN